MPRNVGFNRFNNPGNAAYQRSNAMRQEVLSGQYGAIPESRRASARVPQAREAVRQRAMNPNTFRGNVVDKQRTKTQQYIERAAEIRRAISG